MPIPDRFRDSIGTPLFDGCTKVVILGAGELGKEIAIEAQRLGVETVTVDRYANPPAGQVAHRHYTINMTDGGALKAIIRREKPDAVIPEIEAINTDALMELEEEGYFIVPRAKATKITMNRILLRRLAAEEAGVPTSRYAFAPDLEGLYKACDEVGYPCVVKAEMSSGGLGSSIVHNRGGVAEAFQTAKSRARVSGGDLIVEELIKFDFEVTELALAHLGEDGRVGVTFPKPIGHIRSGSHYHVSWQPFIVLNPQTDLSTSPLHAYGGQMHGDENRTGHNPLWQSEWDGRGVEGDRIREVESQIYDVAGRVVRKLIGEGGELRGLGIFGCELFIKLSDERRGGRPGVYFNEISPRPHDTGMVTLVTQDLSEMALHVRAVLGLPIPEVRLHTPGAAHVILAHKDGSWAPTYHKIDRALATPGVNLRLFGKPTTQTERRMGLALAVAGDVEEARRKAMRAAHLVEEGIRYG